MGTWSSLVQPATAVLGLLSAVVGVAVGMAQLWKFWSDHSRRSSAPDFVKRLSPVAPQPNRRSRWLYGLVVMSTAVVVLTLLLHSSVWLLPASSPRPAAGAARDTAPTPQGGSVPTPSEVALKAGEFTVSVPTVFDRSHQGQGLPVQGSPVVKDSSPSAKYLVALSRKVGSADWYAQAVTPIGYGMEIRWGSWPSGVTYADVCLLVMYGELPTGLQLDGDLGKISDVTLSNLSETLASRSALLRVLVK